MAIKKAKKPKHNKSKFPTLTGTPQLGFLNYYTCPTCGKNLFLYYDGDLENPTYNFKISKDWNYCIKCGTMLDMSEWQDEEGIITSEEEIIFED